MTADPRIFHPEKTMGIDVPWTKADEAALEGAFTMTADEATERSDRGLVARLIEIHGRDWLLAAAGGEVNEVCDPHGNIMRTWWFPVVDAEVTE